MKFLNTANIETPWLQVFLIGEPGSGKTVLASTFPRPLFLQPKNEQSMTSLKGQDFNYLEIDSVRGAFQDGVGGGMLSTIQAIEDLYNKDPLTFPFDTIVVEQIGHYGDIVQRELSSSTMQMDQQKWGLFLAHFYEIQSRLRRLDCHLVWCAHTKIEKVGEVNVICGANIPGQTATKIPSSCDILIFCEDVSTPTKRRFKSHFRRHQGFPARSRFPHPAMIENCTFADIEFYTKAQPEVVG